MQGLRISAPEAEFSDGSGRPRCPECGGRNAVPTESSAFSHCSPKKQHNRHPKPFIWTKTTDRILDAVARFCKRLSNSGHQLVAKFSLRGEPVFILNLAQRSAAAEYKGRVDGHLR